MSSESSRKLWIITLPQQLKEDVRVYGIRKGLKIWETVDEAIDAYLKTFKEQGAIEKQVHESESVEDWSIQIEREKYKQLKITAIENDVRIYDVINTALYRLVYPEES